MSIFFKGIILHFEIVIKNAQSWFTYLRLGDLLFCAI